MSERLGRLGVEFVISIMSGTVCRFVVSSVSTRDDAVILLIYAGLTICTHCQAFLLSHTLSTCLDISHSVRCVDACGAWDEVRCVLHPLPGLTHRWYLCLTRKLPTSHSNSLTRAPPCHYPCSVARERGTSSLRTQKFG